MSKIDITITGDTKRFIEAINGNDPEIEAIIQALRKKMRELDNRDQRRNGS